MVGPHSVIGLLHERELRTNEGKIISSNQIPLDPKSVIIGDETIIGAFVCIHNNVQIGAYSSIDDYTRIGHSTTIGNKTKITYSAIVGDNVLIGNECIIAGFICDNTEIEDNCSVFGILVHKYNKPHMGWWEVEEIGPKVMRYSIVGYNANIIGNIKIGPFSYICEGALVTKNVPSFHICYGTNNIVHYKEWKGEGLNSLFKFWEGVNAAN